MQVMILVGEGVQNSGTITPDAKNYGWVLGF